MHGPLGLAGLASESRRVGSRRHDAARKSGRGRAAFAWRWVVRQTAKWALLGLVVACGGGGEPETGRERGVAAELVASLDVRVQGDTVDLGLYVANATTEPVELEFVTAQRYDFAVLSADGSELWRWSSDQMFAQVLGSERVAAGEIVEYRARWEAAEVGAGRYIAEGEVVSQNRPVSLRTEFELRAR